MANQIKHSGDGLALQVTKPARTASLVEDDTDGEPDRLADVHVFAFDGLLLVGDVDRVSDVELVGLAVSAARDMSPLHRVMDATLPITSSDYQVQLPPATDAGFRPSDAAVCTLVPNILVISTDSTARLSSDLVSLRREQVDNAIP